MRCLESAILPLDDIHDKKKKTFRGDLHLDSPQSLTPGTAPHEIMRHISECAKRDLTFPIDRVNAMRGIFHVFETGSWPVHQLMGVPILPPPVTRSQFPKVSRIKKKLSRNLEQGFLVGLTWSHRQPGKRIRHFPNWTWAGWSGRLEDALTFRHTWPKNLQNTKVWMEMEDRTLLPFPSLEGLRDGSLEEPLGHQQFIHLDAYTFCCSTVQLDKDEKSRLGEPDWYLKPSVGKHYVKATGEDD